MSVGTGPDVSVPGRLEEVADGVFAYVQPDGSWMINNTGFLVARDGVTAVDACSTERRTQADRGLPAGQGPDLPLELADRLARDERAGEPLVRSPPAHPQRQEYLQINRLGTVLNPTGQMACTHSDTSQGPSKQDVGHHSAASGFRESNRPHSAAEAE